MKEKLIKPNTTFWSIYNHSLPSKPGLCCLWPEREAHVCFRGFYWPEPVFAIYLPSKLWEQMYLLLYLLSWTSFSLVITSQKWLSETKWLSVVCCSLKSETFWSVLFTLVLSPTGALWKSSLPVCCWKVCFAWTPSQTGFSVYLGSSVLDEMCHLLSHCSAAEPDCIYRLRGVRRFYHRLPAGLNAAWAAAGCVSAEEAWWEMQGLRCLRPCYSTGL